MKTTTFILFYLFILPELLGQTTVTELNGFRLRQFRETATNEFGKPFKQGKFENGSEYEIFFITPDANTNMVFVYHPKDPNSIWSIQISGNNPSIDIGFRGLKLGVDKKEVARVLGNPDKIEDIGDYGQRWNYNRTNYSVEISRNGTLSGVLIYDNSSKNRPDIERMPEFASVVKLLTSSNNADIASILAPDVEIYHKDQTLYFKRSLKTEIATDHSGVFRTIREISKGLDKIDTSKESIFEENVRVIPGQPPKYVFKIKKGHPIKEIVFDNINGQFLIWEIMVQ